MARRSGGRVGATATRNRAVQQNRGGVGGNASGLLGPVRSGVAPRRVTGAPITNGRPVRQAVGYSSLRNGPLGGVLQPTRTGNPPASGRQGIGSPTSLRSSGGPVSQLRTTGSGGNFARVPLRSSGGRPRQQTSRTVGNFARGRQQNANTGRLGTIGVEQVSRSGLVRRK